MQELKEVMERRFKKQRGGADDSEEVLYGSGEDADPHDSVENTNVTNVANDMHYRGHDRNCAHRNSVHDRSESTTDRNGTHANLADGDGNGHLRMPTTSSRSASNEQKQRRYQSVYGQEQIQHSSSTEQEQTSPNAAETPYSTDRYYVAESTSQSSPKGASKAILPTLSERMLVSSGTESDSCAENDYHAAVSIEYPSGSLTKHRRPKHHQGQQNINDRGIPAKGSAPPGSPSNEWLQPTVPSNAWSQNGWMTKQMRNPKATNQTGSPKAHAWSDSMTHLWQSTAYHGKPLSYSINRKQLPGTVPSRRVERSESVPSQRAEKSEPSGSHRSKHAIECNPPGKGILFEKDELGRTDLAKDDLGNLPFGTVDASTTSERKFHKYHDMLIRERKYNETLGRFLCSVVKQSVEEVKELESVFDRKNYKRKHKLHCLKIQRLILYGKLPVQAQFAIPYDPAFETCGIPFEQAILETYHGKSFSDNLSDKTKKGKNGFMSGPIPSEGIPSPGKGQMDVQIGASSQHGQMPTSPYHKMKSRRFRRQRTSSQEDYSVSGGSSVDHDGITGYIHRGERITAAEQMTPVVTPGEGNLSSPSDGHAASSHVMGHGDASPSSPLSPFTLLSPPHTGDASPSFRRQNGDHSTSPFGKNAADNQGNVASGAVSDAASETSGRSHGTQSGSSRDGIGEDGADKTAAEGGRRLDNVGADARVQGSNVSSVCSSQSNSAGSSNSQLCSSESHPHESEFHKAADSATLRKHHSPSPPSREMKSSNLRGRSSLFHFRGSLREVLTPFLATRKVLVFGGRRASGLAHGMSHYGLDVTRADLRSEIATSGRRGRPLAIIDVMDKLSMVQAECRFRQLSDALCVNGIYVIMGGDSEATGIMSFFANISRWNEHLNSALQNSKGDTFYISILEKRRLECDEYTRSWDEHLMAAIKRYAPEVPLARTQSSYLQPDQDPDSTYNVERMQPTRNTVIEDPDAYHVIEERPTLTESLEQIQTVFTVENRARRHAVDQGNATEPGQAFNEERGASSDHSRHSGRSSNGEHGGRMRSFERFSESRERRERHDEQQDEIREHRQAFVSTGERIINGDRERRHHNERVQPERDAYLEDA